MEEGKETIREILNKKKIKTYKMRYSYFKPPDSEAKKSNPFVASSSELGAHSRGSFLPHKHMAKKDTFGIITRTNERFDREKNQMLFHKDEMYNNIMKIS